jgi:hypothetical protein
MQDATTARLIIRHFAICQAIDTTTRAHLYLEAVGRVITTGLAIVLILAVATVLISPDPSDDVVGLLHRHHVVQFISMSLASGIWLRLLTGCGGPSEPQLAAEHPRSPDILALICSLLC